ncbi:Lin0512 family protein [Fodinisporobacter ferrooxydans]|uniref:Lin0512 family protein n=1 Tax=Fodinisporobacter ferrooxydans TaxID=2901836 RepID=A0ABY4CQM9_9BACL|nr:Lin0512 family protein [Alicyclobacillaceae bacterium MYW30-H2]
MNKVMFIEIGTGIDLHGQDVTVACARACRDAIGHNSMPGLRSVLPGNSLDNMKVHVTLGVPFHHEQVNIETVKAVFPYGQVFITIREGGLLASSGVILPEKGDQTDEMVIVNAVVEVGY